MTSEYTNRDKAIFAASIKMQDLLCKQDFDNIGVEVSKRTEFVPQFLASQVIEVYERTLKELDLL